MMNNVAIRFAVSSLALGMTMVACKPSSNMSRPSSVSARTAKADQQAARLYIQAQEAVRKGSMAQALALAEKSVELSPRDVAYRMLLGDVYLKNGRFRSAEATFGDVLTLDPGNSRASLSLALSQIALGNSAGALSHLDRLSQTEAPGDLGLAYALAGQPQRAIEMLEGPARATDATARVRQNLALAYALAGDWQKARITAAQDMSPADIDGRMQSWAAFAQPSAPHDQVASLLNVTAVEDAGQPTRLALVSPDSNITAFAGAQPAPEAAPAPIVEAPVQVAAIESYAPAAPTAEAAPVAAPVEVAFIEIPKIEPVPAAVEPEQQLPVYAAAAQILIAPQPAVVQVRQEEIESPVPTFKPAPRPKPRMAPVARTKGRFVVQIGAFGSGTSVERAWAQAHRRFALTPYEPLSTTVSVPGKGRFHRLSVAWFTTHVEASRVCQSIKAKRGACFVRTVAGDRPVQWASRYNGRSA